MTALRDVLARLDEIKAGPEAGQRGFPVEALEQARELLVEAEELVDDLLGCVCGPRPRVKCIRCRIREALGR